MGDAAFYFYYFYTNESELYKIVIVYKEMQTITTHEMSRLFSILTRANEIAQALNVTESSFFGHNELIVDKINYNSPLRLDLIAGSVGVVFILLQIIDLSSKIPLEREILKLEMKKLENEVKEVQVSKSYQDMLNQIAKDLEELDLKVELLRVEKIEGDQDH